MSALNTKNYALHRTLWDIFNGVKNHKGSEQFRQALAPRMELDSAAGGYADVNQKIREDFYQALTAVDLCLKDALASRHSLKTVLSAKRVLHSIKKIQLSSSNSANGENRMFTKRLILAYTKNGSVASSMHIPSDWDT